MANFIDESEMPLDELDAEFYDEEFDAGEIDGVEFENQEGVEDTKSSDKQGTLISGRVDLVHGISNRNEVNCCILLIILNTFFSLMRNTISS